MAIPFTCPHCGQHTDVDDAYAGQSGPCVSCGNTISVPTLDLVSDTPAPPIARRRARWITAGMVAGGIVAAICLGIAGFAILQPVFRAAQESARCAACISNLERIALALEEYHAANGHYPPAIEYDDEGTPMHSWRVLLLPYLGKEAQQVHQRYNFSRPWNDAANLALVREIPSVYRCPSDARAALGETSYLAVVGEKTVLRDAEQPTSRGDISDGLSQTMVVIEAAGSTTNWLQPTDVKVSQLRAGLNSANTASPGSNHPQGVNTLLADGSVVQLSGDAPASDLQAMATIDGDEFIETLDQLAD